MLDIRNSLFQACQFSRNRYIYRKKEFMRKWHFQDLKKYSVVVHHPYEETSWTRKQTQKEKFEMLKIDLSGNVDIMLMLGKINAGGSFRYLDEKEVDNHLIERSFYDIHWCKDDSSNYYRAFHYQSRTRTETIGTDTPVDSDLCQLANSEYKRELEPTHVVASVTYGGDAHFVFEKVKVVRETFIF